MKKRSHTKLKCKQKSCDDISIECGWYGLKLYHIAGAHICQLEFEFLKVPTSCYSCWCCIRHRTKCARFYLKSDTKLRVTHANTANGWLQLHRKTIQLPQNPPNYVSSVSQLLWSFTLIDLSNKLQLDRKWHASKCPKSEFRRIDTNGEFLLSGCPNVTFRRELSKQKTDKIEIIAARKTRYQPNEQLVSNKFVQLYYFVALKLEAKSQEPESNIRYFILIFICSLYSCKQMGSKN